MTVDRQNRQIQLGAVPYGAGGPGSRTPINLPTSSKTWPDLRRAGHLGVTSLADHHDMVCRQLAGPVGHRFDGIAHTVTPDGAVVLDDGLAWFDCTVYRGDEAGDHILVLPELHSVQHVDKALAVAPLVFDRSAFGKLQQIE